MSDTIVWKRPDGTVAITHCAPGVDPEKHRDELIARAKADQEAAEAGRIHVPEGHVLASADYLANEPVAINPPMPPRCAFRNAMVWDGKRVVHDMGRARDLRREQLRRDRAPALSALDVDYQRADERGDAKAKAAIAAKKQALRDVTKHPAIDKAATLEELRAVTLSTP